MDLKAGTQGHHDFANQVKVATISILSVITFLFHSWYKPSWIYCNNRIRGLKDMHSKYNNVLEDIIRFNYMNIYMK